MTSRYATEKTTSRGVRFVERQLGIGFGLVSIVAIAMCAMLIFQLYQVAGLVESMRDDESSIRQGRELSAAVRDMSFSLSYLVLSGDEMYLEEYRDYLHTVQSRILSLKGKIPAEEGHRLEILSRTTEEMRRALYNRALPAVQRGDRPTAHRAQRELMRLEALATAQADGLAAAATREMAQSHDHATQHTRAGLLGGGICVLLIVMLSTTFTLRLRSVVLRPLHQLTDAALQYAKGDFSVRVDDVGKGEFAALSAAFSHMADELATREASLLHNERMAAIGQMAAGVAHELNNPIAIIRGYLKTMTPNDEPETLRSELRILDEEAGYCQRIAEDLLAYARAEQMSVGNISMRSFLEETAKRFQVGTATRAIAVEADEGTVQGDGPRLRQVVLNLLSNADRASPSGGRIDLIGRRGHAGYTVEVNDRGPGIAHEDRLRIFEPFYSGRRGGSGLGLAVCHGIVTAHGGSIEFEGRTDGTVFRFWIPFRQASVSATAEVERDGRRHSE